MKAMAAIGLMAGTILFAATAATAQRPGGGAGPAAAPSDDLVTRMMTFDADKDGKLKKDEVTDARLEGLFTRADADKDGVVTKEELTALAKKEQSKNQGFGGPGGPGGFGGPGGGPGMGPGGPGMGGMGGPPRIGEILPQMFQMRLKLDDAQKKKVAELQKEVDEKLAKILTEEQSQELKSMRQRGPGGFGGPGGRGGPGGGPQGGFGSGPPPRPPGGDDEPK